MRASGGGAKSPLWRSILAGVFSKPIATLQTQEGSAYGAALLAMVGTGAFGSVEEACESAIIEQRRDLPDPALTDAYGHGYATFRDLYPALRDLFPKM